MPMKIGGIEVGKPKETTLYIERGESILQLRFVAVTDDSEFEKANPAPLPPKVRTKDGTRQNFEDPNFLMKWAIHAKLREDWLFLQSIKPSLIEWETVDPQDPATYKNWRDDLKNNGFAIQEVDTIYNKFVETNTLTDKMMEDARKRFLLSQELMMAALQESSSPQGEANSTQPSEQPKGSA